MTIKSNKPVGNDHGRLVRRVGSASANGTSLPLRASGQSFMSFDSLASGVICYVVASTLRFEVDVLAPSLTNI